MRNWVFGLALALLAGSAVAQDMAPPGLAFELHLHCAAGKTAPVDLDDAATPRIGDEVYLDITGDQGRILLAHVTAAHKKPNDDWKALSNIQIDDHLITAHYSTSIFGGPLVTVDRMTGRIDIAGSPVTAFHGDCDAVDPNAQKF
jgi:hypothetical protein